MKYKLIFIVFLVASLNLNAQDSLDRYVEYGLKNNHLIKSKYASYEAAVKFSKSVTSLPDPELSMAYFLNPVETRLGSQRMRIALSQKIPWFGTIDKEVEVKEGLAKVKYEEFISELANVEWNIKSLYYEMYSIKKGIEQLQETEDLLQSLLKLTESKVEEGEALVEVLRLKMELNDIGYTRHELELRIQAKKIEFFQIVNWKKENDTLYLADTLARPEFNFSWSEDSLFSQNPDLVKIEEEILKLKSEKELIEKKGMPYISIGLEYISIEKRTDIAISNNGKDALILPKIGISLPIYRKKYTSMGKSIEYEIKALGEKKNAELNNLKAKMAYSKMKFLDAQKRSNLFQEQYLLSKKALELSIQSYSSGGDDIKNLIEMEKLVLKYNFEKIKANSDMNTAVAYSLFLIGKTLKF